MAMTMKERSALGVATRTRNRLRQKFLRYGEELLTDPDAASYGHTPALLAEVLRRQGWTVTPPWPVDERKEPATTQPTSR